MDSPGGCTSMRFWIQKYSIRLEILTIMRCCFLFWIESTHSSVWGRWRMPWLLRVWGDQRVATWWVRKIMCWSTNFPSLWWWQEMSVQLLDGRGRWCKAPRISPACDNIRRLAGRLDLQERRCDTPWTRKKRTVNDNSGRGLVNWLLTNASATSCCSLVNWNAVVSIWWTGGGGQIGLFCRRGDDEPSYYLSLKELTSDALF